eukprot:352807-Chlamydomonas_euryale.AAC.12
MHTHTHTHTRLPASGVWSSHNNACAEGDLPCICKQAWTRRSDGTNITAGGSDRMNTSAGGSNHKNKTAGRAYPAHPRAQHSDDGPSAAAVEMGKGLKDDGNDPTALTQNNDALAFTQLEKNVERAKQDGDDFKTLEHCVSQPLQLTTRTQHAGSDGLRIKRIWLAAFQTVGAVTGMQAEHGVSQPLQQVKDIALCLRVHGRSCRPRGS